MDDCIGVLLNGLAASKYADNTVVMLWGDHGSFLGEKQRYRKTMLRHESCRFALMVKVPGIVSGAKQCSGLVNLIDMSSTLVEQCGLPPPLLILCAKLHAAAEKPPFCLERANADERLFARFLPSV